MDMSDLLKKLFSRPSSASATHYVVVTIGPEMFGVPAKQIQEIICLGDLEAMPRLPKRFTGPVRIIGKLLSLEKLPVPFVRVQDGFEVTARTSILVLQAHSVFSSKVPKGVVVDRVERILALNEDDVETVTSRRKGLWSAYTLGFARRHLPVVLIDLEKLVAPHSGQSASTFSPNGEVSVLKRRLAR
jgi:chemotaxis signal transduction protein